MVRSKLKKHYRSPDYNKLFSKKPYFSNKEFLIWIDSNGMVPGCARFGVVLSKKNVKIAVVRNKYKRISKELFKSYKSGFMNKDIVLVIKQISNKNNIQDWKQRLSRAYTWVEYFIGSQLR